MRLKNLFKKPEPIANVEVIHSLMIQSYTSHMESIIKVKKKIVKVLSSYKFNLNEEVYFFDKNKILKGKISFRSNYETEIRNITKYSITVSNKSGFDNTKYYESTYDNIYEVLIARTKQELLDNLVKGLE